MNLEKRIRYQQPHSIKLIATNEALKEYLTFKEHHRQKYLSSKQSKRLYNG